MSARRHDVEGPLQALIRKGNAAAKVGDVAAARTCFEAAVELEPESPAGLHGVARCFQLDGEWLEASEVLRRLLQLHPHDKRGATWTKRLITCLEKAGRREEAFAVAKQDWRKAPTGARYLDAVTNIDDDSRSWLRFEHVLIVTYGRSGSTLLQGVLNSINGLLVRGENANIFFHLFELYRTLQDNQRGGATLFPNSAWFGFSEMAPEVVMEQLRPLARQLLLGSEAENPAITACGFKEIRYFDIAEDLVEYLQFLESLFPRVAFIFNTRSHDEMLRSGWWADEDPVQMVRAFEHLDSLFSGYAEGRDHCFQISYADVIGRTAQLEALFSFLGAPFDRARVNDVLAVPHSYAPNGDRKL